jgi:diaminopimelate decarboxylase
MEKINQYALKFHKDGLYLESFKLEKSVQNYPTPFYLYSESILKNNFLEFKNAATNAGIKNFEICFALKSNNNLNLLNILAELGAGADIVSGGELHRALQAKISANKIVFSGVGKTTQEMEIALKEKILSFNVESLEELAEINELAKNLNIKAQVTLRFNPKVMAHTHRHISTGFKTHKFGILENDILKNINNKKLWSHTQLTGLSVHIGSQILRLKELELAIKKMSQFATKLKTPVHLLDVGGGLGINYKSTDKLPPLDDYMEMIARNIYQHHDLNTKIVFEPGRRIVARSGFFITKVLRSKTSENHHFLIVDGGMNDLVRPSLYDAYHHIVASKKSSSQKIYDIVGPICETADCFGSKRKLPSLKKDDFIVICDSGAYGYTMGSEYNMRKRPLELLLNDKGMIQNISQS